MGQMLQLNAAVNLIGFFAQHEKFWIFIIESSSSK